MPRESLHASRAARLRTAGVAAAACATLACGIASAQHLDFTITALSSRPDTVTGGDALIRIDVPANVPLDKVSVTVNGSDVSAIFERDDEARTLTGLVQGLARGDNIVAVSASGKGGRRPSAELVLRNHPKEGPIFSGPPETPFICQTHQFQVPVIGGT
ncbi:MAG TPA: DUF6351 family protein, partial [Myxococcaceae bacterium]|nr:DUF6351 family protein [Myxococcaceae bacterium]